MNKRAVIDSNVLVALVDDRDKWHVQAKALLEALKAEAVNVVYFDCVLNETISVMARRSEEQSRSAQFSGLLDKLQSALPVWRFFFRRIPQEGIGRFATGWIAPPPGGRVDVGLSAYTGRKLGFELGRVP